MYTAPNGSNTGTAPTDLGAAMVLISYNGDLRG